MGATYTTLFPASTSSYLPAPAGEYDVLFRQYERVNGNGAESLPPFLDNDPVFLRGFKNGVETVVVYNLFAFIPQYQFPTGYLFYKALLSHVTE